MNNQNRNAGQTNISSTSANEDTIAPAVHEPFTWLVAGKENDPNAQFAALTMDICRGIKTCLDLVNSSNLTRQLNDGLTVAEAASPTLGVSNTERLLRLAIASTVLLGDRAEEQVGHFNRIEIPKPLSAV